MREHVGTFAAGVDVLFYSLDELVRRLAAKVGHQFVRRQMRPAHHYFVLINLHNQFFDDDIFQATIGASSEKQVMSSRGGLAPATTCKG